MPKAIQPRMIPARASPSRSSPLGPGDDPALRTDFEQKRRAEQVGESLDKLMAATRMRILAAQAEAARLDKVTWTVVLIALGAAIGLALLGTAVVARRMTRSIDRLSAATAEVVASAFREPIAIESRDEIGALARSFNWMASELRQMEETKQEFFATVSHELRSPLTSICGAVELLHRGTPGPLTISNADSPGTGRFECS